ncbi:MAG: hypothetical protein JXA30_13175, partial [Deltaproteobacteria bacterium]|nr:hypothetical protein [Deltaproteobacteria bacterium]
EPARGRKPVLRDESAAVVAKQQYPPEQLRPGNAAILTVLLKNSEKTWARRPHSRRPYSQVSSSAPLLLEKLQSSLCRINPWGAR